MESNRLTSELLQTRGFDLEGLTVRGYGAGVGDFQMVEGWWKFHCTKPFSETVLPPLGVVVEDAQGPCAALWCYESFGIGVGSLENPVTRPGGTVRQSSNWMAMAVMACMTLSGKGCEPAGEYTLFRAMTPHAGIARILKKMGFADNGATINFLYLNE